MTGGKFTLGEAIVGLQFNVNVKEMNAAMIQLRNLSTEIQKMGKSSSIAPGAAIAQATATAIKQGQAIIDATGITAGVVTDHLTNLAAAAERIVTRLIGTINRLGSTTVDLPGETGGIGGEGPAGGGPPGGGDPSRIGQIIDDVVKKQKGLVTALFGISNRSERLGKIWDNMLSTLALWEQRLLRIGETFQKMGITQRNMSAFLQATKDEWESIKRVKDRVIAASSKQQALDREQVKAARKIAALSRLDEDLAEKKNIALTTMGRIEERIPDSIKKGARSFAERFHLIEKSTKLQGTQLSLARKQSQIDRRRSRDMLGAAFALTIFGQKLQRLYQGLAQGSTDLAFLQEDIQSGWEETADIIGNDVAPLIEGPIANAFDNINESISDMNEGFRGNLGLLILVGTQAISVVGPLIAMLSTRKMIAASARMQLLTEKQITLQQEAHNKAMRGETIIKSKQGNIERKRDKAKKAAVGTARKTAGFFKTMGMAIGGMFIFAILIELMEPFLDIISEIIAVIVDAFLPTIEAIAEGLVEWGIIDTISKILVGAFGIIIGVTIGIVFIFIIRQKHD